MDNRDDSVDNTATGEVDKSNVDETVDSLQEEFDVEELEESFLEDFDFDELEELISSDKDNIKKKTNRIEILEERVNEVAPTELDAEKMQAISNEVEEKTEESDEPSFPSVDEERPEEGELLDPEIGVEDLFSEIESESVFDSENGLEDLAEDDRKEEKSVSEKKKGFFSKVFSKLFSNIPLSEKEIASLPTAEQQLEDKKAKEEAAKKKKEEKKKQAEENKKKKAEEAKKKAAEAKAKKKAKEEAKQEAKKKAELNRLRAEAALPLEGKINKAGAIIVIFFFLILGFGIVVGSNLVAYDLKISGARYRFAQKEYNDAYSRIRGVEVKEKDMDIYNKVYTVMFVNKQLNSYNNFYAMGDYANALDSLVKGLYRYDKYITYATQIGIKSDLNYVREQIIAEFSETYGMSERDALVLMGIADKQEYSEKVYHIASKLDEKKPETKEEIKEYVP